jgi:hypothetical protein
MRPDRIFRAWSDLAKKCVISTSHLHNTRHRHASMSIKQENTLA